jgi:hypothetical protein
LTEQVIKKNTLDKRDDRQYDAVSDTGQAEDNESQRPENASVFTPMNQKEDAQHYTQDVGSEYSREFSQNVEIYSNRSSEIKFLFGEKPEHVERNQPENVIETIKKKDLSVEKRFVKLYNRQGHYSTSQSIETVFTAAVCQLVRIIQCVFCCQCAGFGRIKESVDFKRFLINFTKLMGLLAILVTLWFILFSINEELALSNAGDNYGVFLMRSVQFKPLPKQATV